MCDPCYPCRGKCPAPPQFYISSASWKYAMRAKKRLREMHARNGLNEPPPCYC